MADKLKIGVASTKNQCSAKVNSWDNDFPVITDNVSCLNMICNAENIQREALNSNVKREAVDNWVENLSKIICEEQTNKPIFLISAAMPKTNKDEEFLVVNNRHEWIIVFLCISNFCVLLKPYTYINELFQFCTKSFQQS